MAKYKKEKKGKGKGKDPFYKNAQVHGNTHNYEMSLDTGWSHGHGDMGHGGPAMNMGGGAGSHKVRGPIAPPPRGPRRP